MLIRTEQDRQAVIKVLQEMPLVPLWDVTRTLHKPDRSLAQNALWNVWYGDRGKQTENGRDYERKLCKLVYGVPILLGSEAKKSAEFRELWNTTLKNFEYEQRFQAMGLVPVSSLMTITEGTEYLNIIETESAIQGIQLSRPEQYKEAMGHD